MEDPQAPDEFVIENIRTRCGYPLKDVLREFKFNLEQTGSSHAAKCLHYTADLLCSGCLSPWKKFLWDFVFDHVGIGSPRVFLFLQKQFFTIENQWNRYAHETCLRDSAFQKICIECILIVRSCQRKPQIRVPRVPPETHNDDWVRKTTGQAPSSVALTRVFKPSHDLAILKPIGEDFCKAVSDGATQKALFWMKWCIEEDSRLKREHQGYGLSNLERGSATASSKQKTHIGYFFILLLAELYKELSAKGLIRMTEEYQGLLNLYMNPDSSMTGKRKQDTLILAIQIICEVPRWKVPAAPGLITDPLQFKRALEHCGHFFQEVLAYDELKIDLETEAKKIKVKEAQAKKLGSKKDKLSIINKQIDAYDKVLDDFMGFR
jgi:hypothetical protein